MSHYRNLRSQARAWIRISTKEVRRRDRQLIANPKGDFGLAFCLRDSRYQVFPLVRRQPSGQR
jgi:hypothetical protein